MLCCCRITLQQLTVKDHVRTSLMILGEWMTMEVSHGASITITGNITIVTLPETPLPKAWASLLNYCYIWETMYGNIMGKLDRCILKCYGSLGQDSHPAVCGRYIIHS